MAKKKNKNMDKKDLNINENNENIQNVENSENVNNNIAEKQEQLLNCENQCNDLESQNKDLQEKYNELNDRYLRLNAEFDNFRKRTVKEKMDLIKTGGSDIIQGLLPVIDDIDRAMKYIQEGSDINSVKEGMSIIYNKFIEYLKQKGVTEIEAMNAAFDTNFHEAIAQMPAQNEESKGKIIDVVQKGYKMNDKILRVAKVVVAQ